MIKPPLTNLVRPDVIRDYRTDYNNHPSNSLFHSCYCQYHWSSALWPCANFIFEGSGKLKNPFFLWLMSTQELTLHNITRTLSIFTTLISTPRSNHTIRMCMRHHTHCSVESVVERGPADPLLSSVCGRGRRVVETSTVHMSVQGLEDRISDHRSRWSGGMLQRNPHCSIYII
jgi:hypothetical protein